MLEQILLSQKVCVTNWAFSNFRINNIVIVLSVICNASVSFNHSTKMILGNDFGRKNGGTDRTDVVNHASIKKRSIGIVSVFFLDVGQNPFFGFVGVTTRTIKITGISTDVHAIRAHLVEFPLLCNVAIKVDVNTNRFSRLVGVSRSGGRGSRRAVRVRFRRAAVGGVVSFRWIAIVKLSDS